MKIPEFSSYIKIENVGKGTGLRGNVLPWLDRLSFEVPMGHPGGESIGHLIQSTWEPDRDAPRFTEEELMLSEGTCDLLKITLLVSGGSSGLELDLT